MQAEEINLRQLYASTDIDTAHKKVSKLSTL